MPNLNGYEVLAEMKANSSLRHIPVIMISAVDEIDSVIRCIELGPRTTCPSPSIRPCCAPGSARAWSANDFTTR